MFNEIDINGFRLILINSNYSFKKEASFNNLITIHVGIGEYSKTFINFIYKAVNSDNNLEIAFGLEKMVFFNYKNKKPVRIPMEFLNFCHKISAKQ